MSLRGDAITGKKTTTKGTKREGKKKGREEGVKEENKTERQKNISVRRILEFTCKYKIRKSLVSPVLHTRVTLPVVSATL